METGNRPFRDLASEFEAVYLSPGSLDVGTEGYLSQTRPAIYRARDFLQKFHSGKLPKIFRRVAIVGCSIRAMEVAQAVKDLRGQAIIITLGSSLEQANAPHHSLGAERKDIIFHFQTGVLGIVEESGSMRGLLCCEMDLKDLQGSGVPQMMQSGKRSFEIQADQMIIAPSYHASLRFRPPSIQESGLVVINENRQLGHAIDPAKEITDRSRSIVREIASGKTAAMLLDIHFRGLPFDWIQRFAIGQGKALSMYGYQQGTGYWGGQRVNQKVPFEDVNLAYFKKSRRITLTSPKEAFSKREALISAQRCFRCGMCTFCGKCYEYCPDIAIRMDFKAGRREIDYDHCKGCGVCAEECPRGAIGWIHE